MSVRKNYQLGEYCLIQYQILRTQVIRITGQKVTRITTTVLLLL